MQTLPLARVTLIVYAILMILGGIMGYTAKHSLPSLMSGVGGGVLLIGAYVLSAQKPKAGLGLGAVATLLLGGALFSRYMKSHQFMPIGALFVVSLIALVVVGYALARLPR